MTTFYMVCTVFFWGVALAGFLLSIILSVEIHRMNKVEKKRERMNDFARTVISVDGYRPAPLPKTLTPDFIRKANEDLEKMQGRYK